MGSGGGGGVHGARRLATVLISALGVLCATPAAGSAAVLPGVSPGQFIIECGFSHSSHNDPIVFPRQPGRSHLHQFFGNRSTRARSTPRSLRRRRSTTCDFPADASAYWVPALLENGTPVRPIEVEAYYSAGSKNPSRIEPLPRGLRMITGDHAATRPQPSYVTGWSCLTQPLPGFGTIGPASSGPSCPSSGQLLLLMSFPDCWDGEHLDSPDHRSHLVYSRAMSVSQYSSCPRSHPVPVTQLGLVVIYPTDGGQGLELASGGIHSAHADFMNGWTSSQALTTLIAQCIRVGVECRG